ncbi:uncharacterized protein LOC117785619 isoform X2 [Drosophila innubila]|uniref:uncharacterized protein LOC117785619 isoform X2 n=1 Tax=Drosophila innubila TaxID=198719 RepID=UPI00148C46DA|nr:uncharacterized protein LOC117785619 isoform X2 [Drosophila innubila]
MSGIYPREAVRVKVKKNEASRNPEWRKFSVDPQITTLEVLYSLLAKAFDIKSDFSIIYKAFDPAGNEIYLGVLSDWDLDAAFLRIHNLSIQTSSEPCLMLQIDVKPFTVVRECETESTTNRIHNNTTPTASSTSTSLSASVSPLQSLGVSQKYVQHMQTKLPGLIMNQMEKTFSIVQKAFNLSDEHMANLPPRPPMCDSEFRLFLDALGQIQRNDELRKIIFQEFMPIVETSAPNSATSTFSTSYSATPTSPSYLLTKPRENPYTKVCALRRQSSSASLSSLSSSVGTVGIVGSNALDNSKRLNHSLDDNMSRHATRRQRRVSSKAHQSLDESKMLALIEGGVNGENGENTKSVLELNAGEDTDDDVFVAKEQMTQFHETNPFRDEVLQPQASNNINNNNHINNINQECKKPSGLTKLPERNLLNVSNMIAKQLTIQSVSESVKRVSHVSHFKDLKEKLAATSRMGMANSSCSAASSDNMPPKLVKNFNEFLNFASINKNRLSDHLANQLQINEKPQQKVQLLGVGHLGSSLDESDSSSIPETSWSVSTAATAIQQAQELSSYSLQLDLNAVTPVEVGEQEPDQDPDQDQEYYPMTNAITRELRLESENLDRQVFGLPFTEKQQLEDDIEYEQLDKDTLDMVEDLQENEIINCPAVSELHMRRRQRLTAAKSQSVQPRDVNPFMEDATNLLLDAVGVAPIAMRNSNSLPEVIMPISTEPNRVGIVEMGTNADDESAYSNSYSRSPQHQHIGGSSSSSCPLPPPAEFGGGNAFLMFLCLTLLLQHRNTIIKAAMDYNEIAMHFDKMVRKHDVTRVLNQARRMYSEYLQAQTATAESAKSPSPPRAAGAGSSPEATN